MRRVWLVACPRGKGAPRGAFTFRLRDVSQSYARNAESTRRKGAMFACKRGALLHQPPTGGGSDYRPVRRQPLVLRPRDRCAARAATSKQRRRGRTRLGLGRRDKLKAFNVREYQVGNPALSRGRGKGEWMTGWLHSAPRAMRHAAHAERARHRPSRSKKEDIAVSEAPFRRSLNNRLRLPSSVHISTFFLFFFFILGP